jgi:plasmid stabilization system protein ParE
VKPVRLEAQADDDYLELIDMLLDLSIAAGSARIAALERALDRLSEFPGSGHTHSHLAAPFRVLNVGDWLIVHEELEDRVIVHRILHGSSDLRSFRP